MLKTFGLFDLEEVVCAVIVNDTCAAPIKFQAVSIQRRLNVIRFSGNDREGAVDLMQLEIRLLYELSRLLESAEFGRREQDPGINEAGKNRIQVVLKRMFFANGFADPVKPEIIIDIFEEKIPAVIKIPFPRIDLCRRIQCEINPVEVFLILLIQFSNILPAPFQGIHVSGLCLNFFRIAKTFNNDRSPFPIDVGRLDDGIG